MRGMLAENIRKMFIRMSHLPYSLVTARLNDGLQTNDALSPRRFQMRFSHRLLYLQPTDAFQQTENIAHNNLISMFNVDTC